MAPRRKTVITARHPRAQPTNPHFLEKCEERKKPAPFPMPKNGDVSGVMNLQAALDVAAPDLKRHTSSGHYRKRGKNHD